MIYTRHARARMAEYGISEAQVEATVNHFDSQVPAREGCVNAYRKWPTFSIRVTLNPTGPEPIIVTVYKDLHI